VQVEALESRTAELKVQLAAAKEEAAAAAQRIEKVEQQVARVFNKFLGDGMHGPSFLSTKHKKCAGTRKCAAQSHASRSAGA